MLWKKLMALGAAAALLLALLPTAGAAELEIPAEQLKALYEETEAPKNDLVSV